MRVRGTSTPPLLHLPASTPERCPPDTRHGKPKAYIPPQSRASHRRNTPVHTQGDAAEQLHQSAHSIFGLQQQRARHNILLTEHVQTFLLLSPQIPGHRITTGEKEENTSFPTYIHLSFVRVAANLFIIICISCASASYFGFAHCMLGTSLSFFDV